MISFQVDDMSCKHCINSITSAVLAIDPKAVVQVDLALHRVDVQSDQAEPAALAQALRDAGYTPLPWPAV